MPLLSGGGKNLWISSGLFLFFALLIVSTIEVALPAAMFYPAIFCLYSEKAPGKWPYAVALIPVSLACIPALRFGVVIYTAILASAVIMHLFIRRERLGLSISIPSIVIFLLFILAVASIGRQSGLGYTQVLSRWVDQILNEVQAIYQGFLSAEEMASFQLSEPQIHDRILALFPSIIFTSIAVVFWMNLLIVSSFFKKIVLREWKCPDWFIGIFILAGFFTVMQNQELHNIGLNLLIIAGQVYFLQGLAIVSSFMSQSSWPGYIRWILYFFILIQVYIMVIVAGIGLFDTWFDFRNRIRTPKGDEQ